MDPPGTLVYYQNITRCHNPEALEVKTSIASSWWFGAIEYYVNRKISSNPNIIVHARSTLWNSNDSSVGLEPCCSGLSNPKCGNNHYRGYIAYGRGGMPVLFKG
jgi:hypothetical protein